MTIEWKEDEDGNIKPFYGNNKVIYSPLPGGQTAFMTCPLREVLFHGNRGGGKSLTLLMSFMQHVGKGYGRAWKGYIVRRNLGEHDDMIGASLDIIPKIFPDAKFNSQKPARWIFKDGETLTFHSIDRVEDYQKFHGANLSFLGFEELTSWVDPDCYLRLHSILRTAVKGMPLLIRATTNSPGPGHTWVKERFRLSGATGRVSEVISTNESGTMKRVAIRGMFEENFVLSSASEDYQDGILESAGGNQDIIDGWIKGSWDINTGGFFSDMWDSSIHKVPYFPIEEMPKGWRLTRAFDYGYSAPFSVLWIAVSNGDSFIWDNKEIGGIKGDTIIFNEWYGANKKGKGLKLLSSDIAKGIISVEDTMGLKGRVNPGIADSAIWTNMDTTSIAEQFLKNGVRWLPCKKGKGSRVAGWQQILELLKESKPNEEGMRENPGLFISSRCHKLITHLTDAPKDSKNPSDICTNSSDHDLDALRYAIYKPKISKVTRNKYTYL